MLRSQAQLSEKKKKKDEEEKEGKQDETEAQMAERKARARQLWRVLQKGFRHAVEKMKNEEMKVAFLSHGLQHISRIALRSPVRHVTHDSLKRLFVALDTENMLHFLREDGSYKSCSRAPVPLMGLLYATEVDRFVGWDEGSLQVLDSQFQPLSQAQSTWPIRCGLYCEQLNRIVTAGEGNLTLWDFRYSYRSLQCRLTLTLGSSEVVSRLALDGTSKKAPRCFACYGTGVAAFDISKGQLLSFKRELHSRAITDITYCDVVGCVVTASRDTTIKVWDENWHIQTVFVGHTAPVIAVTIYPERPLIFSASQDGTIRTWNLDTIDQVDQVHALEPVEALETKTASRVVSLSGSLLNIWKINQLYSLYTPLGSPLKRLSCVNLEAVGDFPVRALCVCRDSSVRLVDVQSGLLLSTFTLEPPSRVQEAAYCLPRETLFVLTEQGNLMRLNVAADPVAVRKNIASQGPKPCCLLLYSHIVDPEGAYATWLQVKEDKSYRKQWQKLPLHRQDKNRFLPIMGHKDGLLSVVEWFSGRIQYQVEAHSPKPVTALAEYPAQTCVISGGGDLTVKMWRLFPYADECLLPLLSFSCIAPAWHMCSLGPTLAVAFQDPETVTYRIVYYNLMEQSRSEHSPEDDAQDDITGLCCCPNLKLFASASRDGSVKVWDMKNQLLRHLKLNTIPECLAFANHWGDLLVGIERHLYLIHHSKYLPNYYKMKLLCAKFLEPLQNTPLPLSDACFTALVKENARRLMQEPPLEESESPLPGAHRAALQEPKVVRETMSRRRGSSLVAARNHDLQLLQSGKLSSAKKVRLTKEMKEEAFEQYLCIFHKEPLKVEIPAEDTFSADEVLEAMRHAGSIAEFYRANRPNTFLGAFTRPTVLKAADQDESSEGVSQTPSSTVPLSVSESRDAQGIKIDLVDVMIKEMFDKERPILLPPRSPPMEIPSPSQVQKTSLGVLATATRSLLHAPKDTKERRDRPPREKFTKSLLAIKESDTALPVSEGSLAPTPATKSGKSIAFKEPSRTPLTRSRESPVSSGSRSPLRLQSHSSEIVKGFFPEIQSSSQERRSQLSGVKSHHSMPLPRISSGFIPNSVVSQQLHSLEDVEEVKEKEEEEGKEEVVEETIVKVTEALEEHPESHSSRSSVGTPPRDKSPQREAEAAGVSKPISTKESPPAVFLTQLDESQYPEEPPFFISPFLEKEWFKALFPEGFPPEMSINEFLTILLGNLAIADYGTKTELVGAIVMLKEKLKDQMKDILYKTVIYVLNRKEDAPAMMDQNQRKFILSALRMLLHVDKDQEELMVELMAYYVISPPEYRVAVKDLIQDAGVQDPHNYFYNELESWPVKEDDGKDVARRMSSQWLGKWMQELKEHRSLLLEQEVPAERKYPSEQFQERTWWRRRETMDLQEQPERTSSLESYEEEQSDGVEVYEREPEPEPEPEQEFSESYEEEEMGLEKSSLERDPQLRLEVQRALGIQGQMSDATDQKERPRKKSSFRGKQKEKRSAHPWVQSVRPVDAIHYFMEKQMEKELAKLKHLVSSATISPRDTVMALPPIRKKRAILRLGETNAMLRKRIPERFYFPFIFPRYLMKGFVPFVKLPLPKITLDPFSAAPQRPPSPRTFTAMQQMVHKYFIPKFSYADSYP
ncbi:WD repeat-containing protein 97 [Sceloporus undulatus]|uniref:WD repeat-containing protein 97 n=1 Tax=Sceloporus undulatus TaxID=8520 RepID=UPI001C4B47AE|nr:WD repeat-containing protein 97 [Sceloporus undulatus]